ncbi:YbhB/YbcL family Raf kinase inhibitor-like protein [Oxalobacteraceae bacterium]|nr:YbhB/YbcL family Raf kinase inhibitor-like protein [Oxalobacteraceae bacterium]
MGKKMWMALCAASVLSGAQAFELSSRDVRAGATLDNAQVFAGFGCTGGNRSPELFWRDAPADTKSFAVTVYDPDAPTGSGWWHWVLYDIPKSSNALPGGITKQGDLADGSKQGRNDYGSNDFGGACPPPGDNPHRYIFTVHALKTEKLGVPADASSALIGYMLGANRLGSASFTATYGR